MAKTPAVNIEVRRDRIRGCGWRQPGGLYLITAELPTSPCGKLPLPLETCPTCNGGIKPTRSWTWINARALFEPRPCAYGVKGGEHGAGCACPLGSPMLIDRTGLLWIGGKFYPTPADWIRESSTMGISRRVSAIPKDFDMGNTWVLVAHREAIPAACPGDWSGKTDACGRCMMTRDAHPQPRAAIFHAFRPTAIEYVVKPKDSKKKLAALAQRGVTLVRVERVEEAAK